MSAIKKVISGSLKSKLVDIIRLKGALSVSDYMKIVLTNPKSGFYMSKDVFGVKGHFTTNPEISQIFGEILGVWILQEWRRFDCPTPLRLVEFGPGRGTLMQDITRTLNQFKQTHNHVNIHLVEISPQLKEVQRQTLKGLDIEWHSHLDTISNDCTGFTAYLAHEFLDALPIHKFIRDPTSNGWRELLIDYDQKEDLRFCIAKQPSLAARLLVPENFSGSLIEVCPQAALLLENVAKRINQSVKGCMLVCDYGFEGDPNDTSTNRDTFRAFKDHQSCPPLKDPGLADLTADIDFGYLKNHIKNEALIFGPVNQKSFLLKCGLGLRLKALLDKANETDRNDLESGADFMINQMGERYKFLAMFPKESEHLFNKDPPAGFD